MANCVVVALPVVTGSICTLCSRQPFEGAHVDPNSGSAPRHTAAAGMPAARPQVGDQSDWILRRSPGPKRRSALPRLEVPRRKKNLRIAPMGVKCSPSGIRVQRVCCRPRHSPVGRGHRDIDLPAKPLPRLVRPNSNANARHDSAGGSAAGQLRFHCGERGLRNHFVWLRFLPDGTGRQPGKADRTRRCPAARRPGETPVQGGDDQGTAVGRVRSRDQRKAASGWSSVTDFDRTPT